MSRVSRDILNSLYPSYLFSFVMGLAPFKIYRSNQFVKIQYSRFYGILSALVYACFVYFLLYVHWCKLEYDALKTSMQKFVTFLYFLLVVGSPSVSVIFNKVHINSILILWEQMYRMDEDIKIAGIKLDYRKLQWSSSMVCLLGISSHTGYLLYLTCIQDYTNIALSYGIYFSLNFCLLNSTSISCFFYTFYQAIGHMFEQVLDNLQHTVITNYDLKLGFDYKFVTQTAVLHQKLCYIARLTNKVTSVQLLISFAVTFSLITLQVYAIVTAFINNNHVTNAVGSLFSIAILFMEKLALAVASRRCMETVPRAQSLLAKILNLYQSDHELSREVNAFSLQILHNQFEITAGNFFVIDIPIFITAGCAITTYIILFMQADPQVDLYQTMKDTLGVI